jgi:hypothetical protein
LAAPRERIFLSFFPSFLHDDPRRSPDDFHQPTILSRVVKFKAVQSEI